MREAKAVLRGSLVANAGQAKPGDAVEAVRVILQAREALRSRKADRHG